MRVLSFPLRIEGEAFSSIEQDSDRQAQQLAQMIVGTRLRERPLAPDFGTFDPVGVGVSGSEMVAAVALSEPDLEVVEVAVSRDGDREKASITVRWIEEDVDAV
jgi:hypothetical protein